MSLLKNAILTFDDVLTGLYDDNVDTVRVNIYQTSIIYVLIIVHDDARDNMNYIYLSYIRVLRKYSSLYL